MKNTKKNQLNKRQENLKRTVVINDERRLAPIEWNAQAMRSIKIRMVATTAAFVDQITFAELSSALGIIATSATTAVYLSSLIRLREIEVWGNIATAGVPVVATLSWRSPASGFFESPPVTHSDTGISFDRPAHLKCKPPQGSVASKWHSSISTDPVVDLRAPTGSIVDFTMDFVISDALTILAQQVVAPVLVGATVGVIYHRVITGSGGTLVVSGNLNSIA